MTGPSARPTGAALYGLLLLLLIAGIGSTFATLPPRAERDVAGAAQLTRQLARAQEALMARAANDPGLPGSLPCPDLITDSSALANHPGDGKADMLTRNQCPSYLGQLPWATLDMARSEDEHGETLWYLLAPGLRDDNSARPLNPQSPTGLQVDGITDIAAVVIAPGSALPGQQRPSRQAADYLEGTLQGTGGLTYLSGHGNDRLAILSKARWMAATGERVTQEVRQCLQQHRRHRGQYPWAAPVTANTLAGEDGSTFGRLPDSQPGAGAPAELLAAQSQLAARHSELGNAGGSARLAALDALGESLRYAQQLLIALRDLAAAHEESARDSRTALATLNRRLDEALVNDQISVSEGSHIRNTANALIFTVDALLQALVRSGLDAEAWRTAPDSTSGNHNAMHALLTQQRADLDRRAQHFTSRDQALPRPTQKSLAPDARSLLDPLPAMRLALETIEQHSQRIQQEAGRQLSLAESTLDAVYGKGKAIDSETAALEKPTASNRRKADDSRLALLAGSSALQDGLAAQAAVSHGGPATHWPMVWSARACSFLETGGWWHSNHWHDSLFFTFRNPAQGAGGTLSANGQGGLSLLVLGAGPALPGQQRPSTRLDDYLEGRNLDSAILGLRGSEFASQPARSDANDQLAF